jgi:ATP-binding cassette subfamily B protein
MMLLFVSFQIMLSLSQAIIPVIISQLFGEFKDQVLTRDRLTDQSILILIIGLVSASLVFLRNTVVEITGQRMERDTRDELYSSLLGKSLTFHDKQKIGDIMSRVATDVRQINLMMNPGFNLVFASIIGIIMPTIFIAMINPQLLLVPIIFIITYYFTLKRYNDTLSPWSFKSRISNAKINARLNETLTGMSVVRGSSNENKERNIFNKNIIQYRDAHVKLGSIQARYYPWLLLGIATAFAILHASILYQSGDINLEDFIQFVLLFQLYRFPTFINIFAITAVTLGIAAGYRILEIINGESLIGENMQGYDSKITGNIEFENVTFGYSPDIPVLKNISFKVEPGQTVALVGMTGSGKTTITKLLGRLYDPQQGRILIDGIDVQEWSIANLRNQMALVEQDIFLFSRSIRDNIALGHKEIEMNDVEEAAKLARAHDFISELPEGYETIIGERGVTLSGGQRQRLAIARAIIKNPGLLILDDASSAIDSKTEDEINQAIREVLKNRVSFLITHRIAQIRKADLIILMDQGSILDVGNHDHLLANSEKYKEIFSMFDSESDVKYSITTQEDVN